MQLNSFIVAAILGMTATVSAAPGHHEHHGHEGSGGHKGAYFAANAPDSKGFPIKSIDAASISKLISKNALPKLSPGDNLALRGNFTSCDIDTNLDGTFDKKDLTTSNGPSTGNSGHEHKQLTIPTDLTCTGTSGDVKSICGFQCEGGHRPLHGAFALEANSKLLKREPKGKKKAAKKAKKAKKKAAKKAKKAKKAKQQAAKAAVAAGGDPDDADTSAGSSGSDTD
ncbi:hypothetical protein TWF694_004512 [Orbilia ellipsospora]|uniref:Uncharacterized protein n=1 Tax=Orbilia ellipsospora TaxID=2528407 RepID=A0AAV9WVN3_9PEZI